MYQILLALLKGADAYAVPRLLREHVADAFALGVDAVSGDLVALDELSLNSLCTSVGKTYIHFEGTVGRSVAANLNLSVLVVLEVSCDHLHVGLLVSGDLGRTDAEEDVADRVEVVVHFLDNFLRAVQASGELVREAVSLGFPSVGVGYRLVESGAEVVDLTVEGVDFSLVVGLYASELVATEVVGEAELQVESSVVCVVSGIALLNVVAGHVPNDRGLEGESNVVAYVVVEVQADLCAEVVGVACAVHVVVDPASAGNYFKTEGTNLAVVTAEEVAEVHCAIDPHVRVVESCAAAVANLPTRGVHAELAFSTYSESRCDLLGYVQAYETAG
mgnify:FL=1